MFYLNSTLYFLIPPVLVFQLEVYYKVDRLLSGLTAQPKGTTAWWYSNKTSLHVLGGWRLYFLRSKTSIFDAIASFINLKNQWSNYYPRANPLVNRRPRSGRRLYLNPRKDLTINPKKSKKKSKKKIKKKIKKKSK